MSARDRYTLQVKCVDCESTGVVDISENDGWEFARRGAERIVDKVPEGFTLLDSGSNDIEKLSFACECGSRNVRC